MHERVIKVGDKYYPLLNSHLMCIKILKAVKKSGFKTFRLKNLELSAKGTNHATKLLERHNFLKVVSYVNKKGGACMGRVLFGRTDREIDPVENVKEIIRCQNEMQIYEEQYLYDI